MEGSFADAATNHGFKRARWRGLDHQSIQDWLIATCQNIRILIHCDRRRIANAMAMAVPVPHMEPMDIRFSSLQRHSIVMMSGNALERI